MIWFFSSFYVHWKPVNRQQKKEQSFSVQITTRNRLQWISIASELYQIIIKKRETQKINNKYGFRCKKKTKRASDTECTPKIHFKIFIKISFISLWWRMILKKMKSSAYLIRANGTYNYNTAKGKPHPTTNHHHPRMVGTTDRPLLICKGNLSLCRFEIHTWDAFRCIINRLWIG